MKINLLKAQTQISRRALFQICFSTKKKFLDINTQKMVLIYLETQKTNEQFLSIFSIGRNNHKND